MPTYTTLLRAYLIWSNLVEFTFAQYLTPEEEIEFENTPLGRFHYLDPESQYWLQRDLTTVINGYYPGEHVTHVTVTKTLVENPEPLPE